MKVSWKQSSASWGPTAAIRKPSTSRECSSRRAWNGGISVKTLIKRGQARKREIAREIPAPWTTLLPTGGKKVVHEYAARVRATAYDLQTLVAQALAEDT